MFNALVVGPLPNCFSNWALAFLKFY
jgi:hypothetical protein